MGRRNRKRRGAGEGLGPEPSEPQRENVPPDWEHGSGEVDRFEAEMVSGAEGEESEFSDEELARQAQEARPEVTEPVQALQVRGRGAAPGQETGGGFRFLAFLRASWAELQRVQWPDRRQVAQATAVVLGFVVIAGAYLGLADAIAQRVIDFIL